MYKPFICLILTCLISLPVFSQIKFENGYFINNSDEVTRCQIKNIDWDYNPVSFKYRLNDQGEVLEANISEVKEFGIDGYAKFIRREVFIDISSMNIDKLSINPYPEWQKKEVFLKILVEGKGTLYAYNEHNFRRFFYLSSDSIKQLIFKEYTLYGRATGHISTNYTFREQLLNDLRFEGSEKICRNINYFRNELVDYFNRYNASSGDSLIKEESEVDKDIFNLNIVAGFNALTVNSDDYATDVRDTQYGTKFRPRVGIEAEFVLPFNKNKWSVILEGSYMDYQDSVKAYLGSNVIKYRSIDCGMTLRHYFFLNNAIKAFAEVNLNSIYNKDLNSSIMMPYMAPLVVYKNEINLGIGAGISYKRLNFGVRYFTPQRVAINSHPTWTVKLSKVSFVVSVKVIE